MRVLSQDPGHGGLAADAPRDPFPLSKAEIGIWILIVVVSMLFAGLSSAYVVLRGSPTWQNIELPRILWLNTALLVVSSITLEGARRAVKHNRQGEIRRWIGVSAVLGAAFIAGQYVAWTQLAAKGVYLPTTHHSSFFYVLTAVHGIHLIGGIGGFGYALRAAFKGLLTPVSHDPLKVCVLYWHAMDVIWIYLFLLLVLA